MTANTFGNDWRHSRLTVPAPGAASPKAVTFAFRFASICAAPVRNTRQPTERKARFAKRAHPVCGETRLLRQRANRELFSQILLALPLQIE